MKRHAACKLPSDLQPKKVAPEPKLPDGKKGFKSNLPKRIPVLTPVPSSPGIIVQVRKVTAEVSELQKNMAEESAARNELQMCVEQLKVDAAITKQYLVQEARVTQGDASRRLMKTLPCKSLAELDNLMNFIQNRSLQWTEYIKLLGGNDINSSIKNAMTAIMDRSVQKQLSWSGLKSTKPSFKYMYKPIVDGIHFAMKENFKDYTIAQGEARIQSHLRNAAK